MSRKLAACLALAGRESSKLFVTLAPLNRPQAY